MYKRPKRNASAGFILIDRSGKFLIVHNIASDFWGFPKGRKKHGESDMKAALRELHEESGKTVNMDTVITNFNHKRTRLYVSVDNFEPDCTVDGHEIDAYDWVTLDYLKNLKTSKLTQAFFNRLDLTIKQLQIEGEVKQQ